MREIRLLADRCRLSEGDLLGLAREAAGDSSIRGIADLTSDQIANLRAVLRLLASPIDLDHYERLPLAS